MAQPEVLEGTGEELRRHLDQHPQELFRLVRIEKGLALSRTNEKIEGLYALGENWNGYEVAAPNREAMEQAHSWIQNAHTSALQDQQEWLTPHVTADEEGNVVFEWWKHEKKLTVYVSPKDVTFVKVWGTNINDEMAEGTLGTTTEFLSAWLWLLE